jgi:hypothetical protein
MVTHKMWRIEKNPGRVALENCDFFFKSKQEEDGPCFYFFLFLLLSFSGRGLVGFPKALDAGAAMLLHSRLRS